MSDYYSLTILLTAVRHLPKKFDLEDKYQPNLDTKYDIYQRNSLMFWPILLKVKSVSLEDNSKAFCSFKWRGSLTSAIRQMDIYP